MQFLSGLLIAFAFVSGFAYLVLMLAANNHIVSGNKHDKFGVVSSFWAFYRDTYDEFGQRLCRYGRFFCIAGTISAIVGFVIRNGVS